MEKFNFVPYQGKGQYIFISYAHANSHLITNIVEKLNGMGYNIWYDSGIEYGDKWIKSIEEHLKNSSLVLSFISPEYSQSDWCMREYTYAEKIGKKVIHIKIADGVLEGGLAMMVSTRQIINDNSALTENQIVNEIDRLLEKFNIFPSHSNDEYNDKFSGNIYSDLQKEAEQTDIYSVSSSNKNISSKGKNSNNNRNKNKKKGKSVGVYIAITAVAVAIIAVAVVTFVSCNNKNSSDENTDVTTAPVYVETTTPYVTETYTEEITVPTTTQEETTTEYTTEETTTEVATTEPETTITEAPTTATTEVATVEADSQEEAGEDEV
jgi:hypothetical protein